MSYIEDEEADGIHDDTKQLVRNYERGNALIQEEQNENGEGMQEENLDDIDGK